MKREVVITNDGSSSIFLPEIKESYHSKHGAIQEAYHVFIKNGLDLCVSNEVAVLEIGFGTGLNALITCKESGLRNIKVNYTGVEAYPITKDEISSLNYATCLDMDIAVFAKIHECEWEKDSVITDNFVLKKVKKLFQNIDFVNKYDIIYFDAFGYRVQPELWGVEIFNKMYKALKGRGVLTTYAARSPIKKAMIEAGFKVLKLTGPPGKREMMQALKGEAIFLK